MGVRGRPGNADRSGKAICSLPSKMAPAGERVDEADRLLGRRGQHWSEHKAGARGGRGAVPWGTAQSAAGGGGGGEDTPRMYAICRKDVRAGAHWLSGLGKAGAGSAAGSGSAGGGGGNCTLRLRQITLEDIWTAKLQVEVQHEGTAQEEAAKEKASPAAAKLGGAPTPPLGGALSLEAALGMGCAGHGPPTTPRILPSSARPSLTPMLCTTSALPRLFPSPLCYIPPSTRHSVSMWVGLPHARNRDKTDGLRARHGQQGEEQGDSLCWVCWGESQGRGAGGRRCLHPGPRRDIARVVCCVGSLQSEKWLSYSLHVSRRRKSERAAGDDRAAPDSFPPPHSVSLQSAEDSWCASTGAGLSGVAGDSGGSGNGGGGGSGNRV
ncbi:unnamed protein product [Closterium sp. NIES-64]|nr:unnamed protein product [Closterium sp. NIES-64]